MKPPWQIAWPLSISARTVIVSSAYPGPIAKHRQTDGASGADEARKKVRSARVGNEPDLGKGLDEARRLGGDDDVAGECDVRAGTGGDAVHRADNRQRQMPQRQHERPVVALDRRAEIDRLRSGSHRAIAEILPGAEGAPGAGQQQYAKRSVRLDACERISHLGVHRVVEAVQALRTVERHTRDPAF